MQQKYLLSSIALGTTILLGGAVFFSRSQEGKNIPTPSFVASSTEVLVATTTASATSTLATRRQCLEEGDVAEYKLTDNRNAEDSATIFVKKDGKVKNQFEIPIPSATHYFPVELQHCGAYAIRTFGYDFKNKIMLAEYRRELWKYDYGGKGSSLAKDFARTSAENTLGDFRISPTEKYVVLTRAFPGQPNFALIIKNLDTMKDDMVFPMVDLYKDHPELLNSLALNGWSSDGRYLWANTFDAAVVVSFIRVDTQTGKAQIFPAPPDVLGGDAFNPDTGNITQHPGNFWSGDADYDAQIRKEREAQGEGTDLYVHNLLTGKRTLIAHSPYATQYFRPKWLSTSTLEYFMPTLDGDKGERREWRED